MIRFFPSLLAADLLRLSEEIETIKSAGADGVHLDIMDNHYVPNLSFGPAFCGALHQHFPDFLIDVHLMVSPVDATISAFAQQGASRISIHPEATNHLDRSLRLIKDQGCEAGLVLNPSTSLDCLTYCSHHLDFVLIMTVNPGFGGQTLIPEVIPKITALRQQHPTLNIAVDGGIDVDNIHLLAQAGANEFIAGSSIFNSPNYAQIISKMRSNVQRFAK